MFTFPGCRSWIGALLAACGPALAPALAQSPQGKNPFPSTNLSPVLEQLTLPLDGSPPITAPPSAGGDAARSPFGAFASSPHSYSTLAGHEASASSQAGLKTEVATSDESEGVCEVVEPFFSGASTFPAPPQTYFEVDYLLWGLDGARVPRLLTSNPAGTPLADISDPAAASTQTLIGNDELGDWAHSGVRARWGKLLRDGPFSRFEFTGWHLFQRNDQFNFASQGGDPILARPFTNAQSGLPDAQVLSLPGTADGSFASRYERQLLGVDPLMFFCIRGNRCESLEAFTGYRFLYYQDEFRATERVRPDPGVLVAPGTEFLVEDRFKARNDYHLIPLGLNYAKRRGDWRVTARAIVAVGFVHQEVDIRGRTTTTINGTDATVSEAGFLALGSNIGKHQRNEFAWIPELNLRVHRGIRDGLWVHAGYTLMYLNDVVRAPSHIDTTIDPNQLPPELGAGTRPTFAFASGDEWIHGLNAGMQWNY